MKNIFRRKTTTKPLTQENDHKTLANLATHRNIDIREIVANNPNLTAQILETLSQDHERLIRFLTARHHRTSSKVLDMLAKDREWDVREAVAKNPNTSKETIKMLSKDNDDMVKYAIASRIMNEIHENQF